MTTRRTSVASKRIAAAGKTLRNHGDQDPTGAWQRTIGKFVKSAVAGRVGNRESHRRSECRRARNQRRQEHRPGERSTLRGSASGRELHVKARAVVVGASCLESTRLLLNSKIANSSGALGHYLHDQFYISNSVVAVIPEARNGKAPRGTCRRSGYIPRFRNLKRGEGEEFHSRIRLRFHHWRYARCALLPVLGRGVAKSLSIAAAVPAFGDAMGEVLPRYENHVRIDKM